VGARMREGQEKTAPVSQRPMCVSVDAPIHRLAILWWQLDKLSHIVKHSFIWCALFPSKSGHIHTRFVKQVLSGVDLFSSPIYWISTDARYDGERRV